MKKSIIISVLLILLLQTASADLHYPVEVASQAPGVRFSKIKIQKTDQKWILTGVVKRKIYNSTVLPGHVDITILGNKTQVVTQARVDYSPSLSLRQWKAGSRFSFTLPNQIPEGSRIKLQWHKNQSKEHLLSKANGLQSAWL